MSLKIKNSSMAHSPLEITHSDLLKELKRELEMRQKFYPGWILQHKISDTTARHRIECIKKLIQLVEKQKPNKGELFMGLGK